MDFKHYPSTFVLEKFDALQDICDSYNIAICLVFNLFRLEYETILVCGNFLCIFWMITFMKNFLAIKFLLWKKRF